MPRVTTSYKLAGTETFRLASQKLLGVYGTNLQNIPNSLRRIFVPDKGKVFVQVDQAGAEALIVAYLTRHGKFRDLFLHGIKSHIFVALHLFSSYWQAECRELDSCGDRPFDINEYLNAPIADLPKLPHWGALSKKIKEHETYYAIAKMVCHAANYGMKGPTFAVNVLQKSEGKIRLSVAEATTFLNTYHKLFPEIHEWHENVKKQLYRNRTLENLFRFPRRFEGHFTEKMFMEANAFVPQSTVGTITNVAYTRVQQFIEDNCSRYKGWDLLNNCHDSYLSQCPKELVEEVVKKKQEFINQELVAPDGTRFRMASEASVGMNWGKYNEVTNPEGLKAI